MKNSTDARHLRREHGLFLDDRGQDERVIGFVKEEIRNSLFPCMLELLAHLLGGPPQDTRVGIAEGEKIGGRKELAL